MPESMKAIITSGLPVERSHAAGAPILASAHCCAKFRVVGIEIEGCGGAGDVVRLGPHNRGVGGHSLRGHGHVGVGAQGDAVSGLRHARSAHLRRGKERLGRSRAKGQQRGRQHGRITRHRHSGLARGGVDAALQRHARHLDQDNARCEFYVWFIGECCRRGQRLWVLGKHRRRGGQQAEAKGEGDQQREGASRELSW